MKVPAINPGDFPHHVEIWQDAVNPTLIKRSDPQTLFASVWAKIEHVRAPGISANAFQQDSSELFAKISIPYLPGVAAQMRVSTINGNSYLVQDVTNELGMNVVLHLHCTMIGKNIQ